MELIIVSGLSGSGKSVALHTLEDMGYYCMDNVPACLMEAFARRLAETGHEHYLKTAVGIDARSEPADLKDFPQSVRSLRESDIECQIVFLKAESATLLKRFSETRRKHPLTSGGVALSEAIELERKLLEPVSVNADLVIDTTHTTLHNLRDIVHHRVDSRQGGDLSLLFQSFGFKHGVPGDADFVFDARCLPNPYWEPALRPLTGRDEAVINFLQAQPLVAEMYEEVSTFLERWIPRFEADNRTYMTVAVGCTGGQHRSVYLAERLAHYFESSHQSVLTLHRELS